MKKYRIQCFLGNGGHFESWIQVNAETALDAVSKALTEYRIELTKKLGSGHVMLSKKIIWNQIEEET